ncbi:MAG: hypothetical protein ABUS57_01145 [Pseudomonadota bacterium]
MAPKYNWHAIAIDAAALEAPRFERSFAEALQERRTERRLAALSKARALGLIDSLFCQLTAADRPEGTRVRKSAVSAGALHPIDVIVTDGPGVREPLLYDDVRRVFQVLQIRDQAELARSIGTLKEMVPQASGHLIVFAGHLNRVASAYDNPTSLLWRDAGAADQLMAMGAWAAGARYVPLGALPDPIIRSIRGDSEEVIGVGCGVLGVAA